MNVILVYSLQKTASTTIFKEIIDNNPHKNCVVIHTHDLKAGLVWNCDQIENRAKKLNIEYDKNIYYFEQDSYYSIRFKKNNIFIDLLNKYDNVRIIGCIRDPLKRRISEFTHFLNLMNHINNIDENGKESINAAQKYFENIMNNKLNLESPPLKEISRTKMKLCLRYLTNYFESTYCNSNIAYEYINYFNTLNKYYNYRVNTTHLNIDGCHRLNNVFIIKFEKISDIYQQASEFLRFNITFTKNMRNRSKILKFNISIDDDALVSSFLYTKCSKNKKIQQLYETEIINELGYVLPI